MIVSTISIAAATGGAFALTRRYLRGANLSRWDTPIDTTFATPEPSKEMVGVNEYLSQEFRFDETLEAKRARFDSTGEGRDFGCTFKADTVEFDGVSVPGEWTLVEGADPSKRLLYLHGGAFTVGSPKSHRPVTSNLARRTGCAVFAPDYRLMPENPRIASVIDSRASYQWLLENGPDGPAAADKIAVAGDSAGGNLTLALSNWLRDNGLRKPDAVVGISPATDGAATGNTIRSNYETDIMLKPLVGMMLKVPHNLLLVGMWRRLGMSPSSPTISPVHDRLHDLPPTLIHVSTTEMLYDDATRYTNKAQAAGSPVTMQSWSHMCHVWHIFDQMLPEAHHAMDEIAKFMLAQGVGIEGFADFENEKKVAE
ncbi:MAG: alpha/beta hydrolase [Kordiimonadaceae bacterium]|nr:alpha/beta hydrolase [Kordiimonadaceae bacterium]MBO6569403.1 alpha/beta hydrolase [Kordiimonadaceae bacterium]MBO6964878.1 alpha/beta hydrolase [Kordiimonadaceae bacterium]